MSVIGRFGRSNDGGTAMDANACGFQRLFNLSITVMIVVLAVSAALLHARLVNMIDLDESIGVDEGDPLRALRAVRLGQPLYHDWSVPPHVLTQYMPLFYIVPGTVARWLNTDWVGGLVVGRGYVYTLWLGIGIAVYALVRQGGGTRLAAVLAALLWYAGELAPEHANSFRPDSPMVFFSLAGVWFSRRSERTGDVLCSALLLVIAFMHKQSAVCAATAIAANELLRRRWVRAAMMLAMWGAGVMVGVGVAQTATAGAFGLNTFGSLLTLSDAQRVAVVLGLAVIRGAGALSGGFVAMAGRKIPRVFSIYFVLAVLLAAASSAKFGSGPNYYLEAYAVGCVLTGLFVSECGAGEAGRATAWLGVAWLAVGLASCALAIPSRLASAGGWVRQFRDRGAVRRQIADEWRRTLTQLQSVGEPLLIEDVYLAARSMSTPVLINASYFASMCRNGRFDDTDIMRRFETRELAGIVASLPLEERGVWRQFPERWLAAMRPNYVLAETIVMNRAQRRFFVYRRRTESLLYRIDHLVQRDCM